jgi:hypothetical protein
MISGMQTTIDALEDELGVLKKEKMAEFFKEESDDQSVGGSVSDVSLGFKANSQRRVSNKLSSPKGKIYNSETNIAKPQTTM